MQPEVFQRSDQGCDLFAGIWHNESAKRSGLFKERELMLETANYLNWTRIANYHSQLPTKQQGAVSFRVSKKYYARKTLKSFENFYKSSLIYFVFIPA
jgi:hypothetical protein